MIGSRVEETGRLQATGQLTSTRTAPDLGDPEAEHGELQRGQHLRAQAGLVHDLRGDERARGVGEGGARERVAQQRKRRRRDVERHKLHLKVQILKPGFHVIGSKG